MKRATMMLAAFLLLGSASVASAEGPWVMWAISGYQDKKSGGPAGWEALATFQSKSTCEIEVKARYERLVADARANGYFLMSYTGIPSYLVWWEGGEEKGGGGFLCLPDTIDPREKK